MFGFGIKFYFNKKGFAGEIFHFRRGSNLPEARNSTGFLQNTAYFLIALTKQPLLGFTITSTYGISVA
jgi:hypothetical protein